MAPRGEPLMARLMPMPAAMTRRTPQKIASPIPDIGPMRETLIPSMDSVSKSSCSEFSLSMEATRPMANVPTFWVMLYQVV